MHFVANRIMKRMVYGGVIDKTTDRSYERLLREMTSQDMDPSSNRDNNRSFVEKS